MVYFYAPALKGGILRTPQGDGSLTSDAGSEDHIVTLERTTDLDGDHTIACWQRISSLAGQISRAAVQELIGCLGDSDPFVRWQAGLALANTAGRLRRRARLGAPIWDKQSPELTFSGLLMLLHRGLQDADPERRAATADALALWDHEVVVTYLLETMQDSEPLVRVSAANALGKIRDKAAVGVLLSALMDPSTWVRRTAADALGAIADPKAVPALQQALTDPQPLVRASIVCALGHLNTPRARQTLEQSARDADPAVRWQAARGLGRTGSARSLAVLRDLRSDTATFFGRPTSEVAASAIEAIERRERGIWNWFRRLFYALRHRLVRS